MSDAKSKPHYVNNKDFSQAVVDYVKTVREAKKNEQPIPVVTDYIAQCFLKIAEGLSHKANFIRYTYREEMVMDAVENCLKAINNYKIETKTRTGNPNAFAYFTQICYYAFVRRITKEKKQQDIKFKFIEQAGIEDLISMLDDDNDAQMNSESRAFVDQLRDRIDKVRTVDVAVKEFSQEEKEKEKKVGLELYI